MAVSFYLPLADFTKPPVHFADYEAMSPQQKTAYLERFAASENSFSVPDTPILWQTIRGDTPKVIIAAATDTNPQVRQIGLKGLRTLLLILRHTVDFDDSTTADITPQMEQAIDALLLTGIQDPHGAHFKAYLDAFLLLTTADDAYYAALMHLMESSDEPLFKAELWFNIFFAVGPRPEAKNFILQTLRNSNDPQTLNFASYLAQGLLDPDFIEPLAQIAANTALEHTPRHRALSALATYGASAQDYLPQLRDLPHQADWKEGCRENAAQSIRHIAEGHPSQSIFLTFPDGTPWRNINPLW